MMSHEMKTELPKETMKLAEELALYLRPGDVITLEGDLGAGKTTFAKGIADGLGVKEVVNSPTFTMIKEYDGEVPFYHMDAYRLENTEEDIGFSEYFYGDGVTVVEWGHFIREFLPDDYLGITIKQHDEHTRTLIFEPKGLRYQWMINSLIG